MGLCKVSVVVRNSGSAGLVAAGVVRDHVNPLARDHGGTHEGQQGQEGPGSKELHDEWLAWGTNGGASFVLCGGDVGWVESTNEDVSVPCEMDLVLHFLLSVSASSLFSSWVVSVHVPHVRPLSVAGWCRVGACGCGK